MSAVYTDVLSVTGDRMGGGIPVNMPTFEARCAIILATMRVVGGIQLTTVCECERLTVI